VRISVAISRERAKEKKRKEEENGIEREIQGLLEGLRGDK